VTDHDALLASVRANPQETVPAGALADHYDDVNEPEVAHVVRRSAEQAHTGGLTHNTLFAPPHWSLTQANSPYAPKQRYAVRVSKPRGSRGKYEILLYGPGKANRYLVWNGGLHTGKEARTLVEGLLDKGHLPYEVPAAWMAKEVEKRIAKASE
jgi:hypothetical protein